MTCTDVTGELVRHEFDDDASSVSVATAARHVSSHGTVVTDERQALKVVTRVLDESTHRRLRLACVGHAPSVGTAHEFHQRDVSDTTVLHDVERRLAGVCLTAPGRPCHPHRRVPRSPRHRRATR